LDTYAPCYEHCSELFSEEEEEVLYIMFSVMLIIVSFSYVCKEVSSPRKPSNEHGVYSTHTDERLQYVILLEMSESVEEQGAAACSLM
jgi:hypothetical protein